MKRLSSSSNQNVEQFKNEISVLLKLQHKNLVKILGYCMEEDEKLIVYEFVKNKSLDIFLQGIYIYYFENQLGFKELIFDVNAQIQTRNNNWVGGKGITLFKE